MELDRGLASRFARIALGHVGREYPNSPQHVMGADEDARTPRDLHPVFFGSYDWHSCVHGWWLLLTLRADFPELPEADAIADLADATFTEEKLAAELAYFERSQSRGFERPYGWAWLLALHRVASRHNDHPWAARLEPLARALAERLQNYLSVLTYPITVGTHFNTAFALVLAREWALENDPILLMSIDKYADEAFVNKSNYSGWEPGGDEFLSPVLIAALLMGKVMPKDRFAPWFDALVLANQWVEHECHPVTVSDRTDGKIAHLDGLNLSRAWCLIGISGALGAASPPLLKERAQAHLMAALPHVAGAYEGEHWLASFALLALKAESDSPR